MAVKPCGNVAGHTIVRGCVDTVGREVYLQHVVALEPIVFGGRSAWSNLVSEHDDAVVRSSYANFILSANHTKRLHSADFGFLYLELLVTIIKSGAYRSDNHSLTGSYVGSATYNLSCLSVAKIYSRYMKMVAIGMLFTCEHLADYDTAQTAFYRFNLFDRTGLKAYGSQDIGEFFGRQAQIDIAF